MKIMTHSAKKIIPQTKSCQKNVRTIYTMPWSDLQYVHKQENEDTVSPKYKFNKEYTHALLRFTRVKEQKIFLIPMIYYPKLSIGDEKSSLHGFVGHVKMFPIPTAIDYNKKDPITDIMQKIEKNPIELLTDCIIAKNSQAQQDIHEFIQEQAKNKLKEFSLLILNVANQTPIIKYNNESYFMEGVSIKIENKHHTVPYNNQSLTIFKGQASPKNPMFME
jgi:hypothetical protein